MYLASAYKSKAKLALHEAFLFVGDIFIADNDAYTATNLYQVALAGFTQMDNWSQKLLRQKIARLWMSMLLNPQPLSPFEAILATSQAGHHLTPLCSTLLPSYTVTVLSDLPGKPYTITMLPDFQDCPIPKARADGDFLVRTDKMGTQWLELAGRCRGPRNYIQEIAAGFAIARGTDAPKKKT
ncbi:hypothetical protein K438DRAFT_1780537 [Mycena galopus ATCC 62051]|nr:hypothetical protein K438DRAFT_1780537 [Mycena galopus ATCC 62051]